MGQRRYPGKKSYFYHGQQFWVYQDPPGQWYYTFDPEARTAGVGPFDFDGDAHSKAILAIGRLVTQERQRDGRQHEDVVDRGQS